MEMAIGGLVCQVVSEEFRAHLYGYLYRLKRRLSPSHYNFAFQELESATDGFSDTNLLGDGGFGSVYRGRLQDGSEIAVKRLKDGSGQEKPEFQAEVEIISRVNHRHLVSMLGYCIFEHQRLLVFEFVPNNTLDFHLHEEDHFTIDWPTRLKIALESAKGLAYLHEDCNPKIIHRDIKAANILLNFNFDVKVADFGLAKFASDSKTHITTRIMGTMGYFAPEYLSTGRLTDKSDVFSLGVLLMELITGKLPFDQGNCLVDWAGPLLTFAIKDGNYDHIIDQRLGVNYNSNEMLRMAACAVACVRDCAESRPRMSKVLRVLEGDASIETLSKGVQPGHSGSSNYDTSDASIEALSEGVQPSHSGSSNYDTTKERMMILAEFNKIRVRRHARSGNHQIPFVSPRYAFDYQKLESATDGFSDANLLGEGGFGQVYRGRLPDGLEIAVKRLKHGCERKNLMVWAEVGIICHVHHRHLVSMLGYCIFERQRLFVFEFVPNKTLDFHLHGKGQPTMDWPTRLKIALESAKGLAYLHEDCNTKIIHSDIKAANILLDFNFDVKVADFGLAQFASGSKTHITTRIMGNRGYLAPEHASTGRLTYKSDVFSFGVMLMELITGKLPFDQGYCLVDLARPLLTFALEDGNYNDVIDRRLGAHDNSNEMLLRMAACAVACVRDRAKSRPRVSKVLRVLEGDASIEALSKGVQPGHSSSSNYNIVKRMKILEKFKKMGVGPYASETATPS